MAKRTFYQILRVGRETPDREIKRAYHKLARQYHPDKASNPDEQRQFEEEFALISEAYNALKDPERRKDYDAKLDRDKEAMRKQVMGEDASSAPSGGGGSGGGESVSSGGGESSGGGGGGGGGVSSGRANIAQKAYVKGVQLLRNGDHLRAVEFFDAAIKNNPNEASYHARMAQALLKSRKKFTRAVESAKKACELDGYNLEYKMTLADIYIETGIKSQAIKQLEDIIRWDNNHEAAKAKLEELKNPKSESFFGKLSKLFGK